MLKITTTYPTPILGDFRIFMDSLAANDTLLSPKSQYLPREKLFELNQLVSLKAEGVNNKLDQASYPLFHLFYHLALAGKLAIMKPGKGGRFRLELTEKYGEYLEVTETEQYFFLLETLWVDADWQELQKGTYGRGPDQYRIASVWESLARAVPDQEIDVTDKSSSWAQLLWDWGYFLYYMSFFGFWRFTPDEEELHFSRRNIKATTITPTAFGKTIAGVLFIYRDYLDWNEVNYRKNGLSSEDVLNRLRDTARALGRDTGYYDELAAARRNNFEQPFFLAFIPLFPQGELTKTLTYDEPEYQEATFLCKEPLIRPVIMWTNQSFSTNWFGSWRLPRGLIQSRRWL